MTNDQQTILGQVSGSEPHQLPQHQQENVQLTELLPVEQSRIKGNPEDKDHETTDGLKALRSFSRNEQQHYDSRREFECFRKLDKCFETTSDDERRDDNRGSGSRKRKYFGESRNQGSRITRSAALELDECRNNGRFRSSKRKTRNYEENVDSEFPDDDTETDGGFDATEQLDSIRDEVEDEVYYFRQQQSDPCDASSNDEGGTNLEMLSAGVYRDMANNFSEGSRGKLTSGLPEVSTKRITKQSEKRPKKKKKKINKDKKKQKILNKAEESDESDSETNESPRTSVAEREDAEKDLRLKIDGIIQANYILERENNNVMQRNQNEIRKSTESSSSESAKKSRQIVQKNGLVKEGKDSIDTKELESEQQTIKKYCCVMCNARFKGSGGLRNHYKVVHAAGPVYKCNECGKEFPLKERLKLHVRTHTGFKPYKCPDCHKSFARGGQLVQHRGTHSKIKPYRCALCAGTFTCAANLALHVKRHNGQKDHKCEICGRGFVRKDALKKHLECLHRDVKSFLCVICNKTFKGHLPQHMRTHAQDRPHGCATCGQRFAQKSQLTVHQRTHSGQRPFRCLVCWQAFAHSTALKLHTRRHTGERPFKCAECNAGFTQLPHWKKHMKCIHGRSEPYSCKNCNSFFRIKNDLENHEKACHLACSEVIDDLAKTSTAVVSSNGKNGLPVSPDPSKFRVMSVERMRLLLAVLLNRISRPERLDELGFGKRLIDEVLQDSLISAGKEPSRIGELTELESLRKNLETFLEWTVPKEHWDVFRKMNKSPEEILVTLTTT